MTTSPRSPTDTSGLDQFEIGEGISPGGNPELLDALIDLGDESSPRGPGLAPPHTVTGETEPSSFWSLTVVTRTQAPSYFGRSRRTARHHNTTLLAHLFTCAPPLTQRRARDMISQQTIYA